MTGVLRQVKGEHGARTWTRGCWARENQNGETGLRGGQRAAPQRPGERRAPERSPGPGAPLEARGGRRPQLLLLLLLLLFLLLLLVLLLLLMLFLLLLLLLLPLLFLLHLLLLLFLFLLLLLLLLLLLFFLLLLLPLLLLLFLLLQLHRSSRFLIHHYFSLIHFGRLTFLFLGDRMFNIRFVKFILGGLKPNNDSSPNPPQ